MSMPEYFQNAIGSALRIRPSPTWAMSGAHSLVF